MGVGSWLLATVNDTIRRDNAVTKLIITRGLPGSGKTTWAREYLASQPRGSVMRLNRDDLRRMGIDAGYGKPERAVEQRISVARDAALRDLLRSGCDVIVDDTNLRSKYVRDMMIVAQAAGADVQIMNFTYVSLEECIRRDSCREWPECVGEEVIRGMHLRYLAQHHGKPPPVPVVGPPTATPAAPVKAYVPPARPAPHAFLVDLDGTLALMNGRGPYDETCVIDDLPNTPVIETVRALIGRSWDPIFMSGRTDGCRADTEVWLLKHVFGSEMITPRLYAPLLMRAAGDTRPDSVVKLELFNAHVRDQYNVRLVLDDRASVIKMWRSLGLTVFQVAEGDF
jgi:predicted kinase